MKAVHVIALSVFTSISFACREPQTESARVPPTNTTETGTNGNTSSGTDDLVQKAATTSPAAADISINEQPDPVAQPNDGVAIQSQINQPVPQLPAPQAPIEPPTPELPSIVDTAGQKPLMQLVCKEASYSPLRDGKIYGRFSCKMIPSKSLRWKEVGVVEKRPSLDVITGDSVNKSINLWGENAKELKSELSLVKFKVDLLNGIGQKIGFYIASTSVQIQNEGSGSPAPSAAAKAADGMYNHCQVVGNESIATTIQFSSEINSVMFIRGRYNSLTCNQNALSQDVTGGELRNFKLEANGDLSFQILDQPYAGKRQNLSYEFNLNKAKGELTFKSVTGDLSGEQKLNLVLKKQAE